MNISIVQTLVKDENDYGCNIARVKKDDSMIIIIQKDNEVGIYDYQEFLLENNGEKYLLLKHYNNPTYAYKDFLKLIGKMCKKSKYNKYFSTHLDEDNRMVFEDFENEHMITREEKIEYKDRYKEYTSFIEKKAKLIDIALDN